jgi:hypothetical protein
MTEVGTMRATLLGAAVLLLVVGCASSNSAAHGSGTVVGRVLSATSCPVERAGTPCPPRPVTGAAVVALRNGDVVASTHSGEGGRFRLALPAGRYVIRATNVGPLASTAQRQLTVDGQQGPALVIRLVVDSGIR